MSEREEIDRFEHDGYEIVVSLEPDYYYEPDDLPTLEEPTAYDREVEDNDGRDPDTGQYVRQPIIFDTRSGPAKVSVSAVEAKAEEWGCSYSEARRQVEHVAVGVGSEDLSYVGVIVSAKVGEHTGEASVWGVEYDLREREPDAYAREVASELVEEAIETAARSAVGGLAPLALGLDD